MMGFWLRSNMMWFTPLKIAQATVWRVDYEEEREGTGNARRLLWSSEQVMTGNQTGWQQETQGGGPLEAGPVEPPDAARGPEGGVLVEGGRERGVTVTPGSWQAPWEEGGAILWAIKAQRNSWGRGKWKNIKYYESGWLQTLPVIYISMCVMLSPLIMTFSLQETFLSVIYGILHMYTPYK